MAEREQQDKEHFITATEYEVGRNMAVQLEELRSAAEALKEERAAGDTQTRGRFTLRLLDPSGSGAFDRFVQVVGADDVGGNDSGSEAELLVSVRPFLPPEPQATGRIEAHSLDDSGIIHHGELETGYFFGWEGAGEEEINGLAMVLRKELQQRDLIRQPLPPFEQ